MAQIAPPVMPQAPIENQLIEPMHIEYREGTEAYAKLITQDREFHMQGLSVIIGRDQSRKGDDSYFCICEQNTVSKMHAQIDWNPERGCF